jgi:SAM-dependent methyltransferase
MPAADRTALSWQFDEAADLYDEVRPGFPEVTIEEIVRFARLSKESRIFEVGCGTGQMTRPFAARGYAVLALDQGPRLAALAAKHCRSHPRVRVVACAFEDWIDVSESYDLFLSANAFHWIRPDYGLARAAELVKTGGTIALVWTIDRSEGTPFWQATDPLYRIYNPVDSSPKPPGSADYRAALHASRQFADTHEFRQAWARRYTGGDYVKLLHTFSDHRALPEPRRSAFFEEIAAVIQRFGDEVIRHYETVVLLARKC